MMPAPITTTSAFCGRTSSEITGSTAGAMAGTPGRCAAGGFWRLQLRSGEGETSDQTAEDSQRVVSDRHGDDEEEGRQRQQPEADPQGERPPISKGQDAQRNVDDEQYYLHRQPGLNEGILLNDDGQEYCGDQKNCIDRVAEVTHRRRLGPAGGCKDSKAAQEEQAAAQRDCQNMKMAQGHVVVGHAAFSPVPEIALDRIAFDLNHYGVQSNA